MIARVVLPIFVTLSAVLAGFYVAVWRVRRRLRPAALLLDEGLQSLHGGLFETATARGHLAGRLVGLRIHLGRYGRTLNIRMACDSPPDFTIWLPGRKGAPRALPVDGYLVLAASEFGRGFASISRDPSRLLAWARQPVTKDRLDALANAKDNWRLELQSGTLEWTDFTCRDSEFTGPDFSKRLVVLAHLASSLEAAAGDVKPKGGSWRERHSQ
jgi:hypothetical protein